MVRLRASPMLLPFRYSSWRHVLALSASARAVAPAGPMLLRSRSSNWRHVFALSASATAAAPAGPMLLPIRFSSVSNASLRRSRATATASSRRTMAPWSPVRARTVRVREGEEMAGESELVFEETNGVVDKKERNI